MIQELANRHQKKAALLLFFMFYLELVAPNLKGLFAAPFTKFNGAGGYYSERRQNYVSDSEENIDIAVENREESNIKKMQKREEHSGSPNIGGPGQPEMTSFQSVNSNDMVDLFSGDFSYNIPLMDVGGYPVNIHYSGGVSMDQEASWVGLGWNLNPGTISRSVRGMPDDFNGTDSIEKTQSVKPNKTTGVTVGADLEIVGMPNKKKPDTSSFIKGGGRVSIGANLGVYHNTYNGWGTEFGLNTSVSVGQKSFGSLTSSLGLSSNTQTGVNVSPSVSNTLNSKDAENNGRLSLGLSTNFNTRSGLSALQLNTNVRLEQKWEATNKDNEVIGRGTLSGSFPIGSAAMSFAMPSYTPSIGMPYTSTSYSFRGKVGFENIALHPSFSVEGYVNKQEIKEEDKVQKKPAVGYLYYSRTNNNINTLMDFNRDKDVAYVPNKTPNIAIPQFTYDVYSISGEGTGGMFRPYRGDMGFVRDDYMKTKSNSDKLSIDLGFGNVFHGGVDFSFTRSYSENNPWTIENDMYRNLKFRENDTTYEAVYFKNPGEKTSNSQSYYDAIGDDQLIRGRLSGKRASVKAASSFMTFRNGKYTGEIPVNAPVVKKQRDKRSQIISYLNAQEASTFGLEKNIYSYKENSIPGISCSDKTEVISRVDGVTRKKHHLSQITVLNGDGRRYVYGIPAYNLIQEDVTFSVNKENDTSLTNRGLAKYDSGSDNTKSNNKGKEGYFSKEVTPAHAHSFLLTAIVSPDYVDLKNDGVTEDDMGDAVKFNYTRVYGDSAHHFKWRTPFNQNKGNYNEGLKSYSRDDKSSYMYGEKEVWYLNSIESKTMVAVFTVANDRKDIYSVLGENGGLDTSMRMRRLKQIDLYVKADLVKDSVKARPVKTVHFSYSYSLCKGVAGESQYGKLTLDSVWFSYNGNEKGKLNPYVFKYHSFNPSYNPKHYDRWGNYKDPASNPKTGMLNSDYPYAVQDSAKASTYASAWMLNEVQLPSGGKIKVTYESDDYAYVQNKRATQFFKIMGVGQTPYDAPIDHLYEGSVDNYFVYIKSPIPLQKKSDVLEKFLRGNDFVYFKLAVKVPEDGWGGGVEFVPVYAEVEDYGLNPNNRFWLKLKPVDKQSPFSRSALEFLRLNLPSKAYPKSEPGDDANVWDVVKLMANSITELATATISYNAKARFAKFCQQIDTSQSFVRLNSPNYKKYGGGLRVKKVEVYDNWKKMTNQKESVYGQEYNYTKTEMVNGKETVISSGVASYEPMIGAEENPFRTPIPFSEKIAPGAPVNHMFVEMPLGESYFPSASVGYSQVRVRTINAKAKSANGWQETEFFTTRDFPTLVENTIIDEDAKEMYKPKLSSILRIDSKNYITLSQGFKIELNDMSGKVKSQASYAETDSIHPISFVHNYYKVDNDSAYQKHLNNTVWTVDSVNGKLNPNGIVGKDIEVMVDLREQYSYTISGDLGVNGDFGMAGIVPLVLPSAIPFPQMETVRYRSMAVVKLVQRYGILDSVVAMDKGSIVTTKNLVYDGETGEVVLSRTNNEFNDPIFNFSYPAHWAYSGMGMAYRNMDASFKNLKLIGGILYYNGQNSPAYPVKRFFESGDEVLLMGRLRAQQSDSMCLHFTIDTVGQRRPRLIPMRAWVMDASKGKEGDKGMYFIDEQGNPLTLEVDYMRIIRSGHRNLLDASVGSIVSMKNPIKNFGEAGYKLSFDSTTMIINTSAVTYKDLWKTENFVYPQDTAYKVHHQHTIVVTPTDVATKRYNGGDQTTSTVLNSKNIIASHDYINASCSRSFYMKSVLNFDLEEIPSDATILSATISFAGRKPHDAWNQQKACKGKGINWATHNDYHEGVSDAYLRRVTNQWDVSTPYYGVHSITSHQVLFNYSTYSNVSCKDLIQDVIASDNFGLAFEIKQVTPTGSSDQVHFLNFCAGNETNVNCTGSGGGGAMSCNCTAPVLTITWDQVDDSLVNTCHTLGQDLVVNPYRLGLLGNWRVEKAYTYYHDRKESDASDAVTHIRKEGELKEFTPFWSFTDSLLLPIPDTTKWVWNSASSLYSKKGFEIENYDPLGRYNAGLYGYNGTLPIAVAQNSKNREVMYDGFEDYGYKSEVSSLCETPRNIDFVTGQSGVGRTDKVSHSGLYSLKVDSSSQAGITVPVYAEDTTVSLSANIDSSKSYYTRWLAEGNGLDMSVRGYNISNSPCPETPGIYTTAGNGTGVSAGIDQHWGNTPPLTNMCKDWYNVRFVGGIQVPYSDLYTFYGLSDRTLQVSIQGTNIVEALTPNVESKGIQIYLQAGKLYPFNSSYEHSGGENAYVRLRWSRSGEPGVIDTIPRVYLYSERWLKENGSIPDSLPDSLQCVQASSVMPKSFIRTGFSPTRNSTIVAGGWIKMDGNDCNSAPALDSVLKLVVKNIWGGETTYYLERTGVRIEGWQRYEKVITLSNAALLSIKVVAPADRNVFADDIRIQPYNSAMKSYAYNPVNLRLMAEMDENNYTTFYEYDDDGTLIRVKKETERGVMTIKESRSALVKNN